MTRDSRFAKLYSRIVQNPKDVSFAELDRVLKFYNFDRRQPRSGSSHYNYSHPKLAEILTIPKDRPVKDIYVKQALAAIEKLLEESGD